VCCELPQNHFENKVRIVADLERIQIERLLGINKERLKYLDIQLATFGLAALPHIPLERDHTLKEIEKLQAQLDNIGIIADEWAAGSALANQGTPTSIPRGAQASLRWSLSFQQRQALTTRLLGCEYMRDAAMRAEIMENLKLQIKTNIDESALPEAAVLKIVGACITTAWGIEQLLDVLRFFEKNRNALQAIYHYLATLRPQPVSLMDLAELHDYLDVMIDDEQLGALYRSVAPDISPPSAYQDRGLLPCMLDTLAVSMDARRPIIGFVRKLAMFAGAAAARDRIQEWVAQIARQLNYVDPPQGSATLQTDTLNPPTEPCSLLIALQPRDRPDSFGVQAWIWGGNAGRCVFERDLMRHVELQVTLYQLLNKHAEELWRTGNDPIIEFFLPELMIGSPIEQKILSNHAVPLGVDYCVIVRSYKRSFDPEFAARRERWKHRWNELHSAPSDRSALVDAIGDRGSLRAALNQYYCYVLACALPARSNVFLSLYSTMIETGTSIALWPRRQTRHHIHEAQALQQEIQQLLHSGALAKIRHAVWQQRIKAHGRPADHPGSHLTLLWDDPHRVPRTYRDRPLSAPAVSGESA
jgi:hypothetical protein